MVRILCHSKAPKQPQPSYWTHAHNARLLSSLSLPCHHQAAHQGAADGADTRRAADVCYSTEGTVCLKHYEVKRNGPVTVPPSSPRPGAG